MKVKLLKDLPIDTRYGATEGRVFDCIDLETEGTWKAWFIDDTGEDCAAYRHECEIINEEGD